MCIDETGGLILELMYKVKTMNKKTPPQEKQSGYTVVTPEILEQINSAMTKKGWSIYRLKKETGISYNTLHGLINQKKDRYYTSIVQKVFSVLGISL